MAMKDCPTRSTSARRRCKPGDLAWIVRCKLPQSLGRIVLVEHIEQLDREHRGKWLVTIQGAPIWSEKEERWLRAAWANDDQLMPFGRQKVTKKIKHAIGMKERLHAQSMETSHG